MESNENKIPQTRNIANALEAEIRSGALPPGSRLPSVRELAAQRSVGLSSVIGAYQLLEKRNLIVREAGRGTFVRSDEPVGEDSGILYGWNAIYENYAPALGADGCSFVGLQYDANLEYLDFLTQKNQHAPGTALVNDGLLPVMAAEKLLQPLNDFVTESLLSKFPATLLRAMSYQGKLYALPIAHSLPKLYFNRAIFRKENLPEPNDNWTWDDVLHVLPQLTKLARNQRIERFGLGMIPDVNGCMPFVLQSGGRLFDGNGSSTISEPAFWHGMELFMRVYTSPGICVRQFGEPSGIVAELLLKNELAMMIGYAFEDQYLQQHGTAGQWGAVRLPGVGGNHRTTLMVNGIGVMQNSRNAGDWIKRLEAMLTGGYRPRNMYPVLRESISESGMKLLEDSMIALQHPSRRAFSALYDQLLHPVFRKMTLQSQQIRLIEKKINSLL